MKSFHGLIKKIFKNLIFFTLLIIIGSCFFLTGLVFGLNGNDLNKTAKENLDSYLNKGKTFKQYKNGLFLGMFNSQEEAEKFIKQKTLNPITLEPYDVIFAFGMSGNTPLVMVWEAMRAVGDNLSWTPLTNYSKIEGLQFDYLVAHSNGNDIANNAIKGGIIKVKNFVALAPPAGFKDEAKNLLGVKSVEIYRTKGDPVAEVLGKKIVFGILQKFGDLNIGIINRTDEPLVGFEISKPWPDKTPEPRVQEKIFSEPYYITTNPHHYETNANNIALLKMYSLYKAIKTTNPNLVSKDNINIVNERLNIYCAEFPEAAVKLDEADAIWDKQIIRPVYVIATKTGERALTDNSVSKDNSQLDIKWQKQDDKDGWVLVGSEGEDKSEWIPILVTKPDDSPEKIAAKIRKRNDAEHPDQKAIILLDGDPNTERNRALAAAMIKEGYKAEDILFVWGGDLYASDGSIVMHGKGAL